MKSCIEGTPSDTALSHLANKAVALALFIAALVAFISPNSLYIDFSASTTMPLIILFFHSSRKALLLETRLPIVLYVMILLSFLYVFMTLKLVASLLKALCI
jgi:Ca2+/Na+ antiporter